jgi:hypothetical protein
LNDFLDAASVEDPAQLGPQRRQRESIERHGTIEYSTSWAAVLR